MDKRLTTAMIGIGGFANMHLDHILNPDINDSLELVAAVDPAPENCEHLDTLKHGGVELYNSIEKYLSGPPAELVVVSTPIHFHCAHFSAS